MLQKSDPMVRCLNYKIEGNVHAPPKIFQLNSFVKLVLVSRCEQMKRIFLKSRVYAQCEHSLN
ncbi:hypothetical protein BpHYR1_032988 [Brachionus plicatilis]|uniref:Uncharacterized protein n=1 Tax=Brachionus plicatilis TaxID=10195 RepID=A0A3M7RFN4_BRAPC|nr:hypothetical protein BpHYR1_032988 [Brachionus plicatilis]